MACVKRYYPFKINIMEEIFEIRSCIEILANDIKIGTTHQYITVSKELKCTGIHTGGSSSFKR